MRHAALRRLFCRLFWASPKPWWKRPASGRAQLGRGLWVLKMTLCQHHLLLGHSIHARTMRTSMLLWRASGQSSHARSTLARAHVFLYHVPSLVRTWLRLLQPKASACEVHNPCWKLPPARLAHAQHPNFVSLLPFAVLVEDMPEGIRRRNKLGRHNAKNVSKTFLASHSILQRPGFAKLAPSFSGVSGLAQ